MGPAMGPQEIGSCRHGIASRPARAAWGLATLQRSYDRTYLPLRENRSTRHVELCLSGPQPRLLELLPKEPQLLELLPNPNGTKVVPPRVLPGVQLPATRKKGRPGAEDYYAYVTSWEVRAGGLAPRLGEAYRGSVEAQFRGRLPRGLGVFRSTLFNTA